MRKLLLSLLAAACSSATPPTAPPKGAPGEGPPTTARAHAPAAGHSDPANAKPEGEDRHAESAERVDAAPHGRVTSTQWGTWIQPKPDSRSLPLGSIRPGSSLPLSAPERVRGAGSCREFVSVEGGFVCASRRAELDPASLWSRAGPATEPAPGPFPYEYAFSVGAPMLTRIPTPEENRWGTGARELPKLRGWSAGHDELVTLDPIEPNGPVPEVLRDGGHLPNAFGTTPGLFVKKIPHGAMLAYTHAFEAHGEVWVLSTDMTIVPAKGLLRFRRSAFRGVELGGDTRLPIAWIRHGAQPKWRRTEEGFEKTPQTWPLRSHVSLTGEQKRFDGRTLLETRDAGHWLDASVAHVARARDGGTPWEVKRGLHGTGVGKWIHVRVRSRTLVLYEHDRPVFATLISPGKEQSTPYGRYFVESKHHVTTMTTEEGEPRKFWIADVPWTIYFKRPYAIHGTYWHEDFGEEKSGGCVNLSPLDAKRIFDWAPPALPEGWGSVQAYPMPAGTFVLVEG